MAIVGHHLSVSPVYTAASKPPTLIGHADVIGRMADSSSNSQRMARTPHPTLRRQPNRHSGQGPWPQRPGSHSQLDPYHRPQPPQPQWQIRNRAPPHFSALRFYQEPKERADYPRPALTRQKRRGRRRHFHAPT
jgi:hypothetical protein